VDYEVWRAPLRPNSRQRGVRSGTCRAGACGSRDVARGGQFGGSERPAPCFLTPPRRRSNLVVTI
jgi:hypothetical protein